MNHAKQLNLTSFNSAGHITGIHFNNSIPFFVKQQKLKCYFKRILAKMVKQNRFIMCNLLNDYCDSKFTVIELNKFPFRIFQNRF